MYTSAKPYFYGTGRRKKSIARVRIVPGTGVITINGRDIDDYFGLETLKLIVNQPYSATGTQGKFDIIATVKGGGFSGQAGAIRHGLARALLQADETYRPALKQAGYLTRDPRMKMCIRDRSCGWVILETEIQSIESSDTTPQPISTKAPKCSKWVTFASTMSPAFS